MVFSEKCQRCYRNPYVESALAVFGPDRTSELTITSERWFLSLYYPKASMTIRPGDAFGLPERSIC